MRKKIKYIEIQEPPIEELKKQKSCLKRTCLSGCGCFFVLILIFLLLLKLGTGGGERQLKQIPDYFPASIPVYDSDSITKITFVSGKNRGKILEAAAFLPKLTLSPLLLALDQYDIVPISERKIQGVKGFTWDNFVKLMKEPMVDKNGMIEIEWRNLAAQPDFVAKYYATKLENSGYSVNLVVTSKSRRVLNFSKNDHSGRLTIHDDPSTGGTDMATLNISLPLNN